LHSDGARHGREARQDEGRAHPRNRRARRSGGQSRLSHSDREACEGDGRGAPGCPPGRPPGTRAEGRMKIRIEDHVKLEAAKMAKIALATTDRAQLDLYCVAPGQYPKPHTHGDQDKIYYVLEGAGRFSLGDKEERVVAGEELAAAAGVGPGLVNDGPAPLLVLVVVTPPPPHGASSHESGAKS